MDFSPPLRITQSMLTVLSTCPRRFQHLHLDQLNLPLSDQQERQEQGQRFHQLMQQWNWQLPVGQLLDQEPLLRQWYGAFQQARAEILSLSQATQISEQGRSLELEGYLLSVVYDLLVENGREAQILDWKTYAKPRRPEWLIEHWQTRLYLYVLCETSDYAPEQVAMVYWFFQTPRGDDPEQAQPPGCLSSGCLSSDAASSEAPPPDLDHPDPLPQAAPPQSLRIHYSSAQHRQTERDLLAHLQRLRRWLDDYEQGRSLPPLPLGDRECESCSFAHRCDRATRLNVLDSQALTLAPTFNSALHLAWPQESADPADLAGQISALPSSASTPSAVGGPPPCGDGSESGVAWTLVPDWDEIEEVPLR